MSEYGYIPESPEQSFGNNKGIFNPKDIYDLTRADKYTNYGQLELIETQTVDDSDFQTQGYGYPSVRFSNNGGSSFISANYQYAYWDTAENTVYEGRSTSADTIRLGVNQYQNMNGYVYLYNLLDSSKHSFTTNQSSNVGGNNVSKDVSFGSGVYPSAEVHNAIRFRVNNNNKIGALKVSLYGIKEYS